MKKQFFASLIMLITTLIFGSSKFPLNGILPPESIAVDETQLYLSSGTKVSIFSLKDVTLVNSFGKKGEGPGEFINIFDDHSLFLNSQSNNLFINSRNKISYFKKDGQFIKEIRISNGTALKPVGENYVGFRRTRIDNKVYNLITLFDKNFKIIKDLHKQEYWFQPGEKIDPITNVRPPAYRIHMNLIFTEDGDGNIKIFNKNGKKINTTSIDFKRKEVSEKDKKQYHDYYRTSPKYKKIYASIKHLVAFPEHFPKINFFDVSDSNLYVFTHIKKETKTELFIFDLNGKLKKKIYIDIPNIDPQVIYPLIKVKNGKIYQIIENEEDEEGLDLYITDIKI